MTRLAALCVFVQSIILPIYSRFHTPCTNIYGPPIPMRPNSYFGFSMDYFNKSVIVSAPAADEFGKIFRLNLVDELINEIHSPLKSNDNKKTRNDWFGATVKSDNTIFVVCAPRYFSVNITGTSTELTRGECFMFSERNYIIIPDLSVTRTYFNGGMDAFGWSVDINHPSIWIGSPALPPRAVKIYRNSISTLLPYEKPTNNYNYGYSIINGNFLSETETYSAVSSTYGDYGIGKVFIFRGSLNVLQLSGEVVGSMFGATLCKAKLGDERVSLLVGAPAFATGRLEYNRGAVYLYVPSSGRHFSERLTLKRIIKGETDAGFFGHAIASVGDLDDDNKDEVAIGAPYENEGRGTVYIYSGAGLLEHKTWMQKIQPEKSKWFGYSLVPIPDSVIAENGLNELAVSAPMSEEIYVFKSIPSITVNLAVVLPNLQSKRENSTYFDFKTVVNIIYPKKPKRISSKLMVKLEVVHPDAKLENATSDGTAHYTFSLDSGLTKNYITFRILTPIYGYYDQVLSYRTSVHLVNEPEEKGELNRGRVQLSERSDLSKQGEMWVSDCKSEKGSCAPDLQVNFHSTITEPYTVGSSDKEQLSLTVLNIGETAYAACAVVTILGTHVLRPPPSCTFTEDIDKLLCKPQRPMRNGDKWETGNIELEMSSLNSKNKNITILYNIYNDCSNKIDKNPYIKSLELSHDYYINVTGVSMPNEYVNMTSVDIKDGAKLQHHYTISNNAITKWVDVKCEILLQKKDYLEYRKSYVMIQKDSLMFECSLEDGKSSENFFTVFCSLGDLPINQITELCIYIEVLPNTLGNILKEQNVTVPTEIKLILREDVILQSKRVTTTLVLNTISVPVWVIVLALFIGLLILLLFIFVLHQSNCFERKNKKMLETLKTESIRKHEESNEDQSAYRALKEN